MAMLAEANGIPASAFLEEDQAHDTIQNIYYSDKIMESNGWHTTEVISSPYAPAAHRPHSPSLPATTVENTGIDSGPRTTTRGEDSNWNQKKPSAASAFASMDSRHRSICRILFGKVPDSLDAGPVQASCDFSGWSH